MTKYKKIIWMVIMMGCAVGANAQQEDYVAHGRAYHADDTAVVNG